ncbi:MAG: transcription elongation factor GreA [Clostridia bacterium]|nr:transcription elongation factor GreA [Clostridia bacterium]
MASKKYVLTEKGRQNLVDELEQLKNVTRKENAERLKIALSFGDLSENSEYDEAKNQQAKDEARIIEIEEILKNSTVLDESDLNTSVVNIGSKVRIYDMEYDEEMEYHIVGSTEAEPLSGKISDESPVGKALMGHLAGEEVDIEVPDGTLKLKILEISR